MRKNNILMIMLAALLLVGFAGSSIGFTFGIQSNLMPEKVDVLIGFRDRLDTALVRQFGGEIYRELTLVNAVAARMTPQAAWALGRSRAVSYVELDGPVFAVQTYSGETEQTTPWGVNRVFGAEQYPFTTWESSAGCGIAVAILDTGIDQSHGDLNVMGGTNTVDSTCWGSDGSGHGTHVAGTVAALDNQQGVVGVSPGVDLYAVKVLNDSGSGTVSSVVAGIEWAVERGIPVINMSLGSSSHSQTLQDAVDTAYDAGHLLVAAAGNSGSPPGRGDNVIYPARYESVIAVAASDTSDKRARWSSTGQAVELIAPGVSILSTIPGDSYGEKSGTSMASPHAAGVAALTWAANPALSNEELRQILRETAEDLGLDKNHQGHGLVRGDLAVAAALEAGPPAVGSIAGTVRDEAGAGISGATVTLEGTIFQATTDGDGSYLLEEVPTGIFLLTAAAEGYYYETFSVEVLEDAVTIQDFTLAKVPVYLVAGTVSDAETGAGIAGALVNVEGTAYAAVTLDDGTYRILEMAAGTYRISASAPGYTTLTRMVELYSDIEDLDFELVPIVEETMYVNDISFHEKRYGPGGSFVDLMITVEVLRSLDYQPVAGARLELDLRHERGSWIFAGETNNSGKVSFTLKRAPGGEYSATVTKLTHAVLAWDPNRGITSAKWLVK